jgi:ribonuclease-3
VGEQIGAQEFEEQKKFLQRMSICFRNENLLRQAFAISTRRGGYILGVRDNERLEFFGDAVINVLVTEYLFYHFPHKEEGDLTMIRSALVRTSSLASIAEGLGMEQCICRAENRKMADPYTLRHKILADTFEAFVGALAIDQGYGACRVFLKKIMFPRIKRLLQKNLSCPKNILQERSSRKEQVNPVYRVAQIMESGENREFHVQVKIRGRLVGEGKGFTKKEAEEHAAQAALHVYSGA